jgi:hypothetical protein
MWDLGSEGIYTREQDRCFKVIFSFVTKMDMWDSRDLGFVEGWFRDLENEGCIRCRFLGRGFGTTTFW